MKSLAKNTGQSLIEIVVAVGVIAVVLVGVSDIITRSISLATFQAEKNKALNYAQYQLTYYRQQRDLQPAVFFATDFPGGCQGIDNTKYTCSIGYTPTSDGTNITSIKMDVTVSWFDGDNKNAVELSQILV